MIMTTVNLSDELVQEAKKYAVAFSRSTPKQIEHWARIGRMSEEEGKLTYNEIIEKLMFDKL